jgi:hypothetical protein
MFPLIDKNKRRTENTRDTKSDQRQKRELDSSQLLTQTTKLKTFLFRPTSLCLSTLRAILNFTPGGQEWNLSPRGEVHPFVHPPRVNTLYCLEEWRGEQRISPPGDNFTHRGQIHPWWTTSPLGDKVFPKGPSLEWASGSPMQPSLKFIGTYVNN